MMTLCCHWKGFINNGRELRYVKEMNLKIILSFSRKIFRILKQENNKITIFDFKNFQMRYNDVL